MIASPSILQYLAFDTFFFHLFPFSWNMWVIETVFPHIYYINLWKTLGLTDPVSMPDQDTLRELICCRFHKSENLGLGWPRKSHGRTLTWCQNRKPLRAPPPPHRPHRAPMELLRKVQRRGPQAPGGALRLRDPAQVAVPVAAKIRNSAFRVPPQVEH